MSCSEGISVAILKELNRGHTCRPFKEPPFPDYHLSPIDRVSKPDGSMRLILDLLSPRGNFINDGIPKELFQLSMLVSSMTQLTWLL